MNCYSVPKTKCKGFKQWRIIPENQTKKRGYTRVTPLHVPVHNLHRAIFTTHKTISKTSQNF